MTEEEQNEINYLNNRVIELETELKELKANRQLFSPTGPTVKTPKQFSEPFESAQKTVKEYFQKFETKPEEGAIIINDQRYVLLRASALSVDFSNSVMELYSDRGEEEAFKIGRNLSFDFAHVIGKEDARKFHRSMNLTDPISKLSAGPVHFAYTGWAFVDILEESNPTPDETFFIKYNHPYSFEADSWIKRGQKSKFPVCSMNAGYSSGWCEESFDLELTAVEISCRAKGDDSCTFIMAPPDKIEGYLSKEEAAGFKRSSFDVPLFFERKKAEETIKNSLNEKVTLLKEIHHRVKNNLQIISSLLSLQSNLSSNHELKMELQESRDRIIAMALLHETLYANKNIGKIAPETYCNSIINSLFRSYLKEDSQIVASVLIDEKLSDLEMDFAIPCGLIINELVSNSIKYAFPNDKGEISIELNQFKHGILLKVADNGIGIQEDLDYSNMSTLGLQIVQLLAEQLNGEVKHKLEGPGTTFEVSLFPN